MAPPLRINKLPWNRCWGIYSIRPASRAFQSGSKLPQSKKLPLPPPLLLSTYKLILITSPCLCASVVNSFSRRPVSVKLLPPDA